MEGRRAEAWIFWRASWRVLGLRATIRMFAPLEARRRATLRPIPWDPPVMMIVLGDGSAVRKCEGEGVVLSDGTYPPIDGELVFGREESHSVRYQD